MTLSSKDAEMLDLVNEQDEIIGEVLKVQANQDPSLWHREVAIILFDKERKVLFQQRSVKKAVNPGKWSISCAGHVTKGMTPEEAAYMELNEELGINTKLIFIDKNLRKEQHETHFTYWFLGKYIRDEIRLETEEVEQAKFISRTELDTLIDPKVPPSNSVIYAKRFWNGDFDNFIRELE
ncbi:NUDIX domain-containing protein [Candidatus Woesebacteria bacterium]|nr:NUDIX domain-containing protein [Candidatus Woesebacteria bacterium]